MANTPTRAFRCPDHLWKAAQDLAKSEGKSVTSLLVGWMEEYVATKHEPVFPDTSGTLLDLTSPWEMSS